MNIPYVQYKATALAGRKLSEFFETSVTIGQVEINWLNRVVLKDLQVLDRKGGILLEADHITAGFKLLPLFNKKWVLTTIRLFGISCHIQKETSHSEMNIQFILDALSGETHRDSQMQIQMQSILIRRGHITYDLLDKEKTHQTMNPNHLSFDNLNCKMSVKHYSKDSLQAQIGKMSFTEKSGLTLNRFSARITSNRDSVCIEDLSLTLPHSAIFIPSATLRFDQSDSLVPLINQSTMAIRLASSTITPKDFAFLSASLSGFPEVIDVSAEISGFKNSISLDELNLMYGKALYFSGSMHLNNVFREEEELFLFGQVNRLHVANEGLHKLSNYLRPLNMTLPEPVLNIEELNFTGEISGFTDNFVAFGKLFSPIGSVQMDMLFGQHHSRDTALYLKGVITSSDLLIHSLFEEGNPYGKVRFNAELDLVQPVGQKMTGAINAQINEIEYRTYNYENIYISGRYKENEYEGFVQVNDPNGQFDMRGLFRNEKEKSVFNIQATLAHFHPDRLHLTDRFENPDISFGLNVNFTGNNPDDFNGYIDLKELKFYTKNDSFEIHDLRIETFANEQIPKQINIASPVLNGNIKGNYSFSSLIPNLLNTIENYLPSLVRAQSLSQLAEAKNRFEFNLTIENTEKISKTLKFPVTILQKTDIHGSYNSVAHSLFASADFPLMQIGKMQFEKGILQVDNSDEAIHLQLDVAQKSKNDTHQFFHFTSELKEDNIHSALRWTNDSDQKLEAALTASTLFIEETERDGNKKLRTEITIPPTQIILKDSIWNIEPASVTISDERVTIDNFYITKNNQSLHINGVLSDNPKEMLIVDLNDLEISYIFNVLNNPQIQFGGRTTGSVKARDLLGSMMIDGRLEINDFSFHNAVQGKLNISSEWDNDRQGILLVGSIYKNDDVFTDIEGYIFPIGKEQGLSLNFDANELNIAFLQRYMKSFSDSVSGLGYGKVLLQGPFSRLSIEGKPYVKDASVKLNILNTTYSFSDTVYLEQQQISTVNTTLYDRENHTGNMDFTLHHTGFKDMSYNIDIRADHMLVYDIPERINPEIYGKVYSSGSVKISGTENNMFIEGNVRSDAGTAIGFNFTSSSTVENYDFITYEDPSETIQPEEKTGSGKKVNVSSGMDYLFKFYVNVTPDAQIELMMNPATGDKINSTGSGSFSIVYGNRNDFQMFGNYLVSGGVYNFNLEQVIRKRFNIRDGSIVAFRGDPMDADLNINAIYNLSANIQDLDELLIKQTASPTIPVNCVLKLEGRLRSPAITFDLELPNSNSELERQVKSFIDTEDMMLRQIIFLLLLQKFYTPDYSRNTYATNEFSAVASSALSAQLSNMLNSLTDKVQIGTNIRSRQDGIKDTEIEMLLSSQLLNNRLLFNGNFGYKDNFIQSNAFIGEFDLEYKLSRTGEISLKAYNHANDLYRYTKSLTRQGVGVMFQKDFTLLSDLRRKKKKL